MPGFRLPVQPSASLRQSCGGSSWTPYPGLSELRGTIDSPSQYSMWSVALHVAARPRLRTFLIEDLDDPGHLFVVSEWESREAADKVLADYANSPNARLANELDSEGRRTEPHGATRK